jgi:hypothetical protein
MKNSFGFIDATRIGLAILMAIMLATMITMPAEANTMYKLDVNYTNGSIILGPLSLGLSTLPTSVSATFTLGPGQPSTEPGEEDNIYFDEEDVVSASITFGNATWTGNNMEEFEMLFDGSLTSLFYSFDPVYTLTADGIIVLNFPLTIIGMDINSGELFEYEYAYSTQTLTEIAIVAIDIKPGSDPNCININGHGVIPVAILGSGDFDVSQIDLASLSFGGLEVRVRGNKGPLCSFEYSNEDMYLDLVCHFEDDTANWNVGNCEATLTGNLIDGTPFEGTDSICIVP